MVLNTRISRLLTQASLVAPPISAAAILPTEPALPRRVEVRAPVRLDEEARVALPTAEAAFHLNRAEQTLRIWACHENGPIRPIRVNGRLAWPVADIRRVLEGK